MGNLLVTLAVIIALVVWMSIRARQIEKGRLKKLKAIFFKISQMLNSNISDTSLYDITYHDARDAMRWYFEIHNQHLFHPKLNAKPREVDELIIENKRFTPKENPYRPIRNTESFLFQINSTNYLVILSASQVSSAHQSTFLEIEKVTSSTPLRDAHPVNDYSPDWNSISVNYRQKQHYICQDCGVDLSSERRLLHVHHKNRDKGDNREKNLIALCASCHKKQPYHERRLNVPEADLNKISLLKKQQGLVNPASRD